MTTVHLAATTLSRPGNVGAVHILLATDADWIVDEIIAALGGPDTSLHRVPRGPRRRRAVVGRRASPTSAILDLQIGSMGGMAVTMALRLDESAGTLPHVPVLMLLDRVADVHLAQRCGADGLAGQAARPAAPAPRRERRAGGGTVHRGRRRRRSTSTCRRRRRRRLRRRDARESTEEEPAAAG